jgi:3-oxoacyl-[acyl-carrier protein] reductase
MVSIESKVAVVTGAGRGIGRGIAIELGRMGARVALVARTRAELEQTAEMIGSGAYIFTADVRNKERLEATLQKAAATLGPIDILVNAAGLGIFGLVVNFKDDDFQTLIETNLRGTFFTCRYVLPSMIERKAGHIVNVASIAGKVGSAARAVYCASKFAVVGFTESLAEEVRQYGIRASVICPGSTNTGFSPEHRPGTSVERMLRPEDVAHVVRMIVTQEPNSFISEVILRPTQKP